MSEEPGHERSLAARFPELAEDWTPSEAEVLSHRAIGLVDAVDHLLNRGACIVGDATISLGGVELIYLGLSLVISSVETLRRSGPGPSGTVAIRPPLGAPPSPGAPAVPEPPVEPTVRGEVTGHRETRDWETADLGPGSTGTAGGGGPEAEAAGPSDPAREAQNGLARLVLTLVELLRQVLERQAVRRMEGASLSEEEIERMGIALLDLETKLTELRDLFGLSEADLNVDLGPLGRLL